MRKRLTFTLLFLGIASFAIGASGRNISWDLVAGTAPDPATAQGLVYNLYLDGDTVATGNTLSGVTCTGATPITCKAPFPLTYKGVSVSNGTHSVDITVADPNNGIESAFSVAINVKVNGAPGNLRVSQ